VYVKPEVNPEMVIEPVLVLQLVGLINVAVITGLGFTVIIEEAEFLQPVAVICPITVYVVGVAVGLAITLLPVVVFNPVVGLQVYVSAPLAVIVAPVLPLHIEVDIGFTVTLGNGFTVMVNVLIGPLHPSLIGVMVMVDVIEVEPELVTVNAEILPVPFALNPMAVLLFVQLNVAPVIPEKFIGPKDSPAHFVKLLTALTEGKGFTIIFELVVVVPHSFVTFRLIAFVVFAVE